ncbi:cmlA [Symbiodinium sp. CCMP2456]|nr:cmlA [Symbiodinium sp. CCMP2456]
MMPTITVMGNASTNKRNNAMSLVSGGGGGDGSGVACEEEFGENWDRQQRTLQRERNPRQQDNIFDTLSFVRWKVNRQLRQAMQDVEKGNKVNLPRKQDRSAGPPPPDPVWIVGDREDSGLEKARERIATLRAKKYRGKPFMPMGQGRGWRVDQDLFDHVDELFQQYGEPAAINEEDSESGHSDSSSALQRRVVSAPASMRRVQARRITRSRAKSRELSVLPPWMRQMLVQDDIWQQLPESSPWDRTCWLQPVRVKGRTATDRAITPEQVAKALSRKSSRSDKPRRVAEDPVLFVRKACASIVEEYAEKAPENAAPTVKPEAPGMS